MRDANPIWDELCRVLNMNPRTKAQRSRFAKVVRELQEMGADPSEIGRVHQTIKKKWPRVDPVSPECMAKHWDQMLAESNKSSVPMGRNWARG